MSELGGRSAGARPGRPSVDATIPELVGHAIGRNLAPVRITAGIALSIAGLGMLGLFVYVAAVPYHDDRAWPALGESCFSVLYPGSPQGDVVSPPMCVDIDEQDREEMARERERDENRRNRVQGTVGALISCTALLVGWRAWRRPWKQGQRAGRRGRFVLAGAFLSPVAAFSILMTYVGLIQAYRAIFE